MTNTQIMRFLKNDDSSTIHFRRFNLLPTDRYPTFSLCFTGTNLRWYNYEPTFDSFGLFSPVGYEGLLKGQHVLKSTYNYKSKLYDQVRVSYANESEENVQQFSLSISDILEGLTYSSEEARSRNSLKLVYGRFVFGYRLQHIPLDVEYKTPDTICFTRDTNESLNTLRKYDMLAFDQNIFSNPKFLNVAVQIFIHYPQQLLRSFH